MTQNIGTIDKIIRGVIGLIFLYVGYTSFGSISIISYILGIGFLITAITGFCLIYKLFGINTKKTSVQIPVKQQEKPIPQPAVEQAQFNQPSIEQSQPTNTQPNQSVNQPSNEPPKSPGWPTN